MRSRNIFLLLLLNIFLIGCTQKIEKVEKEKFLFGTYFKISIFTDDKKSEKNKIEYAFDEIERIDKEYNSKTKESKIDKLNSYKKETFDKEGIFILKEIKKAYDLSGGKYDVTIEPLMKVWGFSEENEKITQVPSKEKLDEAISKVDFSKIRIKGNEVFITKNDIKLDTGSFLKGYATKQAVDKLKELKVEKGLISSISSITAIGNKPDGSPWRIGIQDPDDASKFLGVIELADESMGVSGDYQTYVEIAGKKYHHILDKKTGYPVDDKKMVVAIASDAFKADIYSTMYFLLPIEDIIKSLDEIQNLKLLIVDKNRKIYTTKNLKFEKGK